MRRSSAVLFELMPSFFLSAATVTFTLSAGVVHVFDRLDDGDDLLARLHAVERRHAFVEGLVRMPVVVDRRDDPALGVVNALSLCKSRTS